MSSWDAPKTRFPGPRAVGGACAAWEPGPTWFPGPRAVGRRQGLSGAAGASELWLALAAGTRCPWRPGQGPYRLGATPMKGPRHD